MAELERAERQPDDEPGKTAPDKAPRARPEPPAREAGANVYLTKPYQELELVEQVGDMLDIELTPGRVD